MTMAASASSPPPSLPGVSEQSLEATGVTLASPEANPSVPQDAAIQTALAQFPGTQLRGFVLAHATKKYLLPDTGSLCWVVSITPPMATASGPLGSREIPVRYFLVFIDAQTGGFLFFHYYADVNP